MTDVHISTRQIIVEPLETIMERLPQIGKVMIIGKTDAVTHERIGTVERVEQDGALFHCRGENHDSSIDGSTIIEVITDTSSVMRDQVYPRLDFNGSNGKPIFSVVGFSGLASFDTALAGLSRETLANPAEKPARIERPEVAERDAGRLPLEEAQLRGSVLGITFNVTGFTQRWTGPISKISLGMGFINVMTEDFHLHLPGGSVSNWQVSTNENFQRQLAAISADGQLIGLTLVIKEEGAH